MTTFQLRTVLLLRQIPFLLLILGVMAVVSLVTLNSYVTDWTAQIETHVLDSEQKHIITLANTMARTTQIRFKRMISDIIVQRDYAQQLINHELVVVNPYATYHVSSTSLPTDLKSTCVWFNRGNIAKDPISEPFLKNSTSMLNVWRGFRGGNIYSVLFIAMNRANDNKGLYVVWPAQRLPSLAAMNYMCVTDGKMTTGYHPQCRQWFQDSLQDSSQVHFSAPYKDAFTGNILITASAAIASPGNSSDVYAVVGADINFNKIDTFFIANGRILDHGFSFLVDNTTGQLLIYPNMDRARPHFMRDMHFSNNDEADKFETIFNTSVGQAKATGMNKQFKYTKDGEIWHGSVRTLNATNYVIGAVVPESDILKPVEDVRSRANTALAVALTVTIVAIGIMLVVSILLNLKFASSVTTSVFELSEVVKRFSRGDFSRHVQDKKEELKEMHGIRSSFQNLALAVRFSNPDYFKNDTGAALTTSLDVEKMLLRIKNFRGLGVVRNNIALHCHALDLKQKYSSTAKTYAEQSIDDGKTFLAHLEKTFQLQQQKNIIIPGSPNDNMHDQHNPYLPQQDVDTGIPMKSEPLLSSCSSSSNAAAASAASSSPARQQQQQENLEDETSLPDPIVTPEDIRHAKISINNRLLNSIALQYNDARFVRSRFEEPIRVAKELQDASGLVSARLRYGEALFSYGEANQARKQFETAVQEASEMIQIQLHAMKSANNNNFNNGSSSRNEKQLQQRLSEKLEALSDACAKNAQLRVGDDFDTDDGLVSRMHAHLNLQILLGVFADVKHLEHPEGSTQALKMLSYVLTREGQSQQHNSNDQLRLATEIPNHYAVGTINPAVDLKVRPNSGPQVAVENMFSGASQSVDSLYNTKAIAGDFGGAQFDEFGNPVGSQNDLAADGAFKGFKILILLSYREEGFDRDVYALAGKALEKKGFEIEMVYDVDRFCNRLEHSNVQVAWIVSSWKKNYNHSTERRFVDAVRKFHHAGGGLMIMGDNDPFYVEANEILKPLFGFELTGNTPGRHELKPGTATEKGHFSRSHLIFTGVLKVHEGVTICYPNRIPQNQGWELLGTSSDGNPVFIARDTNDIIAGYGRVIVDMGMTKLLRKQWSCAGNSRYITNCGAWLALAERPKMTDDDFRVLRLADSQSRNSSTQLLKISNAEEKEFEKLPSLRQYMIKMFMIAYLILISIVFLVLLIVCLVTTGRVRDDLKLALQAQVERQATSTMTGSAAAFTEDLSKASASFTEVVGYAASDTFRTSPAYSLAARQSYYDTTPAVLKPPVVPVHLLLSSLGASAFYLPNFKAPHTSLSPAVMNFVNQTSNLDPLFSSLYSQAVSKFFNLAVAFSPAYGFSSFRRIPGFDSNNHDPNRLYDPTKRSWYTATINYRDTVYSTPYRDFLTNKWMITVSSRILHPSSISSSTPVVVGAALADILLYNLVQDIRDLRIGKTGKVTLLEAPDVVVADVEFTAQDSNPSLLSLSNLKTPAVSDSMKKFIVDTPLRAETTFTRQATFDTTYTVGTVTGPSEGVMVIPTRVSGFGDKYYFVAFVKTSEVFGPFEALLSSIKNVEIVVSVILVGCFVAACIAATISVLTTSTMVAAPIKQINKNVARMVMNVGSPDLTSGCKPVDGAAYLSAHELSTNFNVMLVALKQSSEQVSSTKAAAGSAQRKLEYIVGSCIGNRETFPAAAGRLPNILQDSIRSGGGGPQFVAGVSSSSSSTPAPKNASPSGSPIYATPAVAQSSSNNNNPYSSPQMMMDQNNFNSNQNDDSLMIRQDSINPLSPVSGSVSPSKNKNDNDNNDNNMGLLGSTQQSNAGASPYLPKQQQQQQLHNNDEFGDL